MMRTVCGAGALAVLALVPLSGCNKHGMGAPKGGAESSPARVKLQRLVEIVQVRQRPIVSTFEVVGVLEAEGQTDVAAGVSGIVDEVLFREGDAVTAGTVLVKIDQDRFEADAGVALANLERAQAAAALARDLADRTERAGRGASEEEKVKTRGAVGIAEAELRQAQASLRRATRNLGLSRVQAPYAGRINKRMVTKGSYVEEKTPLATIADLSRIRLQSYVAEKVAPTVRNLFQSQPQRLAGIQATMPLGAFMPGQPNWAGAAALHLVERDYVPSGFDPEFRLEAMPGRKFLGRIFYMSTVGTPDTHQFEVKAEVLGWNLRQLALASKEAPLFRAAELGHWLTSVAVGRHPWTAFATDPRLILNPPVLTPQLDLRPGFTAIVSYPLRTDAASMVIPEEAGKWEAVRASEHGFIAFVPAPERDDRGKILTDSNGRTQWVAQRRRLELGFRAPGWVEVRSGLRPGEWVVRRGADTLEEGTPLTIPPEQEKLILGGR